MAKKPTYKELEKRVRELEREALEGKRAAEALRECEKRFRDFADSLPETVYETDAEGNVTFFNRTGRQVFGCTLEDFAEGLDPFQLFLLEDRDRARQNLNRTLSGIPGSPVGYRLLRKDGSIIPVIVHANPLMDKGKCVGTRGLVIDISDQKGAEDTARESEERLRQIVQNMPVMLDALDEDNRILVWNRECERVTGYSAEEMTGVSNILEILYPDKEYLSRVLAEWAERGDEFYNWEINLTCKDGTVRTVAWSNISKRFPIPGWKSWAIGVDVSERKQAEEALRRERDKLQEALAKIKVLSEWYASYLRSV
jgi:PAS domain S-box-containing protein